MREHTGVPQARFFSPFTAASPTRIQQRRALLCGMRVVATCVRFACLLLQDRHAAQGIARLVLDGLQGGDLVSQARLLIALGLLSGWRHGGARLALRAQAVSHGLQGGDPVSQAQLPRMHGRAKLGGARPAS